MKAQARAAPSSTAQPHLDLARACMIGDPDLIKAALERGADPLGGDWMELVVGMEEGPQAQRALDELIQAAKGAPGWGVRSNEVLGECAAHGRLAAASALLAAGAPADPPVGDDGKAPLGAVPLAIASQLGDLAMIRALVQAGASLRAPAWRSFEELESRSPLREAIRASRTESVELLLALGADVESIDSGGWSALGSAASRGEDGCLRALIRGGADIETRNAYGSSPAMTAARCGEAKCLMILAEAGADLDAARDPGLWGSAPKSLEEMAKGDAVQALAAIRESRSLRAELAFGGGRSGALPRL